MKLSAVAPQNASPRNAIYNSSSEENELPDTEGSSSARPQPSPPSHYEPVLAARSSASAEVNMY